jgi:hypothetical protein
MRLFRLVPLLVLLICPPAFGDEYFVRTGGSNANTGRSPDQAWATVAHAAGRVGAGDTVYVGAGSYAGQLYMDRRAGNPGRPIAFVADTAGERTGDAGPVTLTNGSGLVYLRRSHHVRFSGFAMEVAGGNTFYNDGSEGIVIERCTIVSGGAGVHGSGGSSWTVTDSSITVSGGHGVYLAGSSLEMSGSTVTVAAGSASTLFVGQRASATVERSTLSGGGHVVYVEASGLELVNTIIAGGSGNGVHAGWASELTLVHCTVHGVGQDGIYAGGGAVTLRNSIFSDSGRYAIFRAGGTLVESNNVYHGWGPAMTYGFTPAAPVLGDPRFVDASAMEFGLRAGSAARDAGMDASAWTTVDRLGGTRPEGAGWDSGAVEGLGGSRTLFVRRNGSDRRSGRSASEALRTIQAAVDRVDGPGYTVVVGPGVYREGVTISGAAGAGAPGSPNRIVADPAGERTGDDPGAVVLDGRNGSIAVGLRVDSRAWWEVEGLRFTGQRDTAVEVSGAGIAVVACEIDVPRSYGVLVSGGGPVTVAGCAFTTDEASGHAVVVQVTNTPDASVVIEDNRLADAGDRYLASGFGSTPPEGSGAASGWRYGVYARAGGNGGGAVVVRNNIVTDKYVGLYVTAAASGPVTVSHNTVVGCTFPVYTVGGAAGSVVTNNIVSRNFYGLLTDGVARVEGLCEHGTAYPMGAVRRANFFGEIVSADPRLDAPAEGRFALAQGSASIDAGVAAGSAATDIEGNPRPRDGDGDGVAVVDLGAMEEVAPRGRVRVVRWREVSPLGE